MEFYFSTFVSLKNSLARLAYLTMHSFQDAKFPQVIYFVDPGSVVSIPCHTITNAANPPTLHPPFSYQLLLPPFSRNNSPLLDSFISRCLPFSLSVSHLDSQGGEISSRSEHIDLQKGDDDDVNSNNASRLGKKFSSSP